MAAALADDMVVAHSGTLKWVRSSICSALGRSACGHYWRSGRGRFLRHPRLAVPAGYQIPAHWHSTAENPHSPFGIRCRARGAVAVQAAFLQMGNGAQDLVQWWIPLQLQSELEGAALERMDRRCCLHGGVFASDSSAALAPSADGGSATFRARAR